MKKLLIVFMVFGVLLSSCSKNNTQDVEKEVIAKVFEAKSVAEQRSIFNSLNNDEKVEVFKKKFADLKATAKLNDMQYKFVDKLINLLTPDFYSSQNKALNETDLKNEAVNLFGAASAFDLLGNVNLRDEELEGPRGCSCSKKSDYCPRGIYCHDDDCTTSSSGCGTFWGYSCNGMCF